MKPKTIGCQSFRTADGQCGKTPTREVYVPASHDPNERELLSLCADHYARHVVESFKLELWLGPSAPFEQAAVAEMERLISAWRSQDAEESS